METRDNLLMEKNFDATKLRYREIFCQSLGLRYIELSLPPTLLKPVYI